VFDIGVGNNTKFDTGKQPKVSVQAGDGSGTIAIKTSLASDVDNTQADVTASAVTKITVKYTVAGLIS
jgi:hypothetical protein